MYNKNFKKTQHNFLKIHFEVIILLWPTVSSSQGKSSLLRKLFAVKVLRVIGLSPCQPDHAFESSTTIKVIIMHIPWPSSSLWKVRDPVTKELCNHFDGELFEERLKDCVVLDDLRPDGWITGSYVTSCYIMLHHSRRMCYSLVEILWWTQQVQNGEYVLVNIIICLTDIQMSNTSIWRYHCWERWHFWWSAINIDTSQIQYITGFCSSPLPIFKLSLVGLNGQINFTKLEL